MKEVKITLSTVSVYLEITDIVKALYKVLNQWIISYAHNRQYI